MNRDDITDRIDIEPRTAAIYVGIALALAAGAYAFVMVGLPIIARIPTILLILYSLFFVAGVAFVPLICYTIGPSLGVLIPEALANLLWILSMLGVRRGVLEQTEDDRYVIRRADRSTEPAAYWTRWALVPFGISLELTKQTFEPLVLDEAEQQAVEGKIDEGDGMATADMTRGHQQWYIDLRQDVGKWLVPIGEALEVLRRAGSPEMGIEAFNEKLKEEGGDTGEFSQRTDIVATLVFTVLGGGMGYLIFF